jgi:hypothetical protein
MHPYTHIHIYIGDSEEEEKEAEENERRGVRSKKINKNPGPNVKPYNMDRYMDYINNNYISGDSSVLMFGSTASRQPMNAIRLDRELRMCYTGIKNIYVSISVRTYIYVRVYVCVNMHMHTHICVYIHRHILKNIYFPYSSF